MEVSSLLCLGAQSLGGVSAGWPWGLQEPGASILMTWKSAHFLHSWKGVLLTCLPTVGTRTRTRKRKGTNIKATVSKTETRPCKPVDSGLGCTDLSGSVRLAVREGSEEPQQLRFKLGLRCVTHDFFRLVLPEGLLRG